MDDDSDENKNEKNDTLTMKWTRRRLTRMKLLVKYIRKLISKAADLSDSRCRFEAELYTVFHN